MPFQHEAAKKAGKHVQKSKGPNVYFFFLAFFTFFMSQIVVTVNTVRGDSSPIEVISSATILTLKEAIAEKMSIPVAEQKLIFNGRIMYDSQIISEAGFFLCSIYPSFFIDKLHSPQWFRS
jgi:hypothetical protein